MKAPILSASAWTIITGVAGGFSGYIVNPGYTAFCFFAGLLVGGIFQGIRHL